MFLVIFFALAILLALGFVFAAVQVGSVASRLPGRMFQGLMFLLVVASAASVVLSGRSLQVVNTGLVNDAEGDMGTTLAAKAILAGAIGLSVALCIAYRLRGWWRVPPTDRYLQAGVRPPVDITVSMLVFFVAFSLVPFVFAPDHAFHISLVYPFFIFLALLLWMRLSVVDPVVVIKQTLGVLVLGSLLAAIVRPSMALEPGYVGLIPGFSRRLWGITATANTLGSCTLALFMIEVCEPASRRFWHWTLLLGSIAAMVLSQSKAAIGTAALGAALVYSWRWLDHLRTRTTGRRGSADLIFALGLLVVAATGLAIVWALLADPLVVAKLTNKLNADAVADLATGTGRVQIWQYAWSAGLESPIFGHGMNMWDRATRIRTGLNGASHAHNEFLQVFTRAGLIGLAAYLWFLCVMVAYAWRGNKISRGGTWAFMLVYLLRSMVEVPLQPNSVLGGEFFAFMMMLCYLADRGTRARPERQPFAGAGRMQVKGAS